MSDNMEFSKEQQYHLAEYIYSYGSDILITSDAEKALEVLKDTDLISKEEYDNGTEQLSAKHPFIADKIMLTIQDKIPEENRKQIMSDYYAGKLP